MVSLYLALIFALVGQIQSSKLYSGTLGVQEGPSLDIGEFTLVKGRRHTTLTRLVRMRNLAKLQSLWSANKTHGP